MSSAAFTVKRGIRNLASVDGLEVLEHRRLSPEEKAAIRAIATSEANEKAMHLARGRKAADTRRKRREKAA